MTDQRDLRRTRPAPYPDGPAAGIGSPAAPRWAGPQRPLPQGARPGPPGPPLAAAGAPVRPGQRAPGPAPGPVGPPPLLTHADGAGGPVRRPAAPPPGPPGPPPGRPGGGGGRGDGEGRARRSRKRLVRRIVLGVLAAGVLGPLLAFAIGWLVFPVPGANDIAVNQVATVTFADGSPLATVRPDNVNRTNVELSQVPKHVQHAVFAAEDRSFERNPGFDISGIGRAVWSQVTGGVGGGSTITQQYIKVTTGQDEFSLFRKYREIILAAKISKEMTKDEILQNYLNAIYLGRGAYGIQAAAKAYFGKDVSQLTPSEGAMIAGVIQSPSRWDPAKNPEKAQERWAFVLDGMVSEGWMSAADRAQQVFPKWLPPADSSGVGIPGDANGIVYRQVRAELEQRGISESELNTQGLTIETTIDPDLQDRMISAVNAKLKGQPDNLRAAAVAIDPKTGAVRAYFGGNNGVGLDYAQAMKQPGSSFKPFVLAAALQQPNPIGLGTVYDGSSPQTIAGQRVTNSEGVSCGSCTVKTAMTQSINTVFYRMAVDIGPQKVADAAHKAGIPTTMLQNPTGGIALGDKEVRTIDMASAYATFAADGVYHEPYLVSKVTTSDGRVIFDHGVGLAAGNQVFSQQVARNVTESMTDVASSSRIGLSDGRTVAAKTGTVQLPGSSNQNKDAWTVGYTPSLATAVWIGTDDNSAIKNSAGGPIYGRMVPGSIWQAFMSAALKGTPKESFSKFTPIGQPPYDESLDGSGSSSATTQSQADGQSDGNGNGNGSGHSRGRNNGNQDWWQGGQGGSSQDSGGSQDSGDNGG